MTASACETALSYTACSSAPGKAGATGATVTMPELIGRVLKERGGRGRMGSSGAGTGASAGSSACAPGASPGPGMVTNPTHSTGSILQQLVSLVMQAPNAPREREQHHGSCLTVRAVRAL